MKKLNFSILLCFLIIILCIHSNAQVPDNTTNIKFGAYYFDGWTGNNKYQLSSTLKSKFTERQPVWGWKTSKQDIIDKQIELASSSGLSFFNFCWYYNGRNIDSLGIDDKNNALKLFMNSSNKQRLNFAITVVNNKGYEVKSQDWSSMVDYWCKIFKDPSYLNTNGKPLITFFDLESLVKSFGSADNVKVALMKLRTRAIQMGFQGVEIAVCLSPSKPRIALAERCGYDILTSYNRHGEGLKTPLNGVYPITDMQAAETKAWTDYASMSKLPQIPTITLNWDKRPQEATNKLISSRFTGYSGTSVKQSILGLRKWINGNKNRVTKDQIVNIYAWNEYGEGAWLTPSPRMGNSLLDGFKMGLRTSIN